MSSLVSDVLVVVACLLAIPVFVFILEIVAALILPTREPGLPSDTRRQRVGILVPAHNESAGLGLTVENIKAQLVVGDRLLVVADNCVDDTAAVAAAAGAEVIARVDPARAGKGYALDFGIRLALIPPFCSAVGTNGS